jgi:Zn2+/Cd2+-exporting ATPase
MDIISYKVTGLDCAEEVAVLKKEVGTRTGVQSLDFDVINAKMTVAFDPAQIKSDAIVAAVSTTGMRAVPWSQRTVAPESLSPWQQQGRLIMVYASGGFLLLGTLLHWLLHGSMMDAFFGRGVGVTHTIPLPALAMYVGGIITGAWFVVPKAVLSVKRLQPDMNLLMTVAVIGAAFIGEWFEAATVATLFALSLMLEQWSVGRARRAVASLMTLTPSVARYICCSECGIMERPVEEVPVGATVLVRPGERIPLDGIVTKGTSTVNQSPITGESTPVSKEPGDEVFAGTINDDGAIEFQSSKPASDTTLSRIIHLVQEAQGRRAPSQQFVEKFAVYYTPAMMALSLAIIILPPLLMGGSWTEWFYRGLVILVIACPCALVISTPVSIVSALTSAARNGVLIKGGLYLEAAGHIKAVALDKTGTLTHGKPEVQQVIPLNGHSRKDLLERAASLEGNSQHPLAKAIIRKAAAEGIEVSRAEEYQEIKGKGARGIVHGKPFWIGSSRLMQEIGMETIEAHDAAVKYEDAGHSVVIVGNDSHVCGLVTVADAVRNEAFSSVEAMRRLGIRKVVMLSGDNEGTARAIAELTGVDEYRSELLPEDKVKAIENLTADLGATAMIGDGINDAPAMAAATIGIAMGSIGTDTAIETADIAFMTDDLSKLPWLISHSRRTLTIIKQNIGFALGLKLLFIILTMMGTASLWMAIAADTGASLLVIFNGLRLLHSGRSS